MAAKNGASLGGLTAIFDELKKVPKLVCPASISLGFYVGAVSGWGKYPLTRGIQNYAGSFQVTTASIGGIAKLLLPSPVGVSYQSFVSADGNMDGFTVGVGVSSEVLKLSGSRFDVPYSQPYLLNKFHPNDTSVVPVGWAPPTEAQAQAFIAYINTVVGNYLFFGPPLAAKMTEIVRYNQRAWKNVPK